MDSQDAAFDLARTSLQGLGLPNALPALHAAGLGISRAVLGGSHSVAIYPPIHALMPLDPSGVVDRIIWGGETSLYVHIAFCETRCTFCHYTVDHYAGRGRTASDGAHKVARYLTALKCELAAWGHRLARSGTSVSSVYIGGGTPLVLDGTQLCDLIAAIRNDYDVLADAEICIEGSPLTITAADGVDKLRSLKELGVTRLSFGVQSFDDDVLKYAARGYKRDIALRACAIADEIFENWNLDLIQGLYKGSPSEVWDNLKVIADVRPPHLTWYHGRFADRPQRDWYRSASKQACFETEFATLLGRMLIWQQMAAQGYGQTDGNRFVRNARYTDSFKTIRTSASRDLLGVGAGSYSHVAAKTTDGQSPGYVFRNETSIGAYTDAAMAGRCAVTAGRALDGEETLAASYATALRTGRVEDTALAKVRIAHPRLVRQYDALVRQYRDLGVLETYRDPNDRTGLRLSQLGRLFEDETLARFFSPSVKAALSAREPQRALRYA